MLEKRAPGGIPPFHELLPLLKGNLEMHWPAYALMRGADVLVPNKCYAISNHHAWLSGDTAIAQRRLRCHLNHNDHNAQHTWYIAAGDKPCSCPQPYRNHWLTVYIHSWNVKFQMHILRIIILGSIFFNVISKGPIDRESPLLYAIAKWRQDDGLGQAITLINTGDYKRCIVSSLEDDVIICKLSCQKLRCQQNSHLCFWIICHNWMSYQGYPSVSGKGTFLSSYGSTWQGQSFRM